MSLQYHRQLESIHVNTMEPRAYFIPFAMPECKGKAREESDRFQLLNGEWDFRFIPDVERVGIAKEGFADKITCEETVTVPKCWQMYTDRKSIRTIRSPWIRRICRMRFPEDFTVTRLLQRKIQINAIG